MQRILVDHPKKETAEVLKVSEIPVARDWKLAKAWLYTSIEDNGQHAS